MATTAKPKKPVSRRPIIRPQGVHAVTLTLDQEAYDILTQEAPTMKAYGRFLSRLIYEHRLRKELTGGLAKKSATAKAKSARTGKDIRKPK